jgi:hypothetical protein
LMETILWLYFNYWRYAHLRLWLRLIDFDLFDRRTHCWYLRGHYVVRTYFWKFEILRAVIDWAADALSIRFYSGSLLLEDHIIWTLDLRLQFQHLEVMVSSDV